ncbi:MAG: GDCCVxC domain-containing (seleno)protein [Saprospiraceae bacterium]
MFGAGAAASATVFTERYSWLFFGLAAVSLGWSGWQFWQKRRRKNGRPILESVLTCPHCSFQKMETMPENACTYFYDCAHCKTVLKPLPGDCCVFCSYGTVKCPPIQVGENCC